MMNFKRNKCKEKNNTRLRAVAYSRTSGLSQKDNTSIPRQQRAEEAFIAQRGWEFVGHYVDECKSGANIAGRSDFVRMMRDAANDKFDVIVPYDATRFARDGCDIIYNAKVLKNTYGVYVVDTQGKRI
jgi:DNA invertase Pin-like site-specific DNA recombinase